MRRTSRLVYQFQHVLIRDVTYGGLPKAQRGELHERVADVFDRQGGHPDELVGHHLEQAFRCLSEVGADSGGRRLDVEAGTRLGAAGVAAWKRGDTSTTLNLLQRATSLLPRDDPFRLALCCELGVALRGAGNLGEADEVLSAAASTAAAAGDLPAALRARLELANVRLLAAPGDRAAQLLAVVEEAIPLFEAAGDDHALSRAWRLRAYVEGSMACRYAASAESAELALKHCKQSGWSTAACLGDLAAALYHGPTPVDAGIRRCRQLLSGADMGGEANVLVQLGGLEAMRGDLDTARTLIARSQQLYEQLGQPALAYANCGELLGTVELLAGDPSAAAEAFRESCDALESIGDRAYLATRAAQLAGALYADGHLEAAAEWCRVAEESAAPDDVPTQFMWRAVRAKLLATQGEVDEALSLGREAMRLAAQTDALNQRGDVAFALAEALRLSGRTGEWASTASEALALYDQKGNVVAAARVRSLLST